MVNLIKWFARSVHVDGLHNDVHCTFICKRLLLQELAKSVDIYRYLYIYICSHANTMATSQRKSKQKLKLDSNWSPNYIPGHLPERQKQHRSDLAWPTLLGAVPKLTALRHFKIYAAELSIMAVWLFFFLCTVPCVPEHRKCAFVPRLAVGPGSRKLNFSRPSICRLLSFIKNQTRRSGVQSYGHIAIQP